MKGEGNQQDYGMRIYDPRVGRFLSVDPIQKEYPWYTPYSFAGNKPVWAIDLDGEEEKLSTGLFKAVFGSPSSFAHPKTPLEIMTKERLIAQKTFSETRTAKFFGAAWNFSTGTVGTLASISYIAGTDGVGAALGGTLALQFSLGEMAIGTTQMLDLIFSKKTNDALQNSGSIPGLIAYGAGSKYAPFIDALGQFTPTLSMAGSIKGLVKSGAGIIDAARTLKNTPSVANTIGFLDQISDTYGFGLQSFNLVSEGSNGKLQQKLSYSFTYKIQKGDNLSKIAKKFNTTSEEIGRQNGIIDLDSIKEGQSLNFSKTVYGKSSNDKNNPK